MTKVEALQKAICDAEAEFAACALRLADVSRLSLEAEAELSISPTVTAAAQAHASRSHALMSEARAELARGHKLANRIAASIGLSLDDGSGGTKGGPQPEEVWNPLGWLFRSPAAETDSRH